MQWRLYLTTTAAPMSTFNGPLPSSNIDRGSHAYPDLMPTQASGGAYGLPAWSDGRGYSVYRVRNRSQKAGSSASPYPEP